MPRFTPTIIGIIIVGTVVAGLFVWFFFFSGSTPTPATQGDTTGGGNTTVSVTPDGGGGTGTTNNTGTPTNQSTPSTQTIFKIATGPVVAATFIQTTQPTTTLVRYIAQDNAHVTDFAIDVPGAVGRGASNITIPGISEALWAAGGRTALLRYVDNGVIKTLSLTFSVSTTTKQVTSRARFLPDGITGAAFSPDGKNMVYLLRGASGADGYTAFADGSAPKKLFSLPLSQLIISWPSAPTVLLYTKSSAGVPGVLFSVNISSGSVSPLLYAEGLTAIANSTFTYLIYQTAPATGQGVSTYVRNIKTGLNMPVSFDPYPEKCVWSPSAAFVVYCARPLSYAPPTYLDSWHQGATSFNDSIFGYNLQAQQSVIVATPGSGDGGVPSDILSLAVSPDDQYLLFIKKDDRSLWGVRLGQ
ncbi:hypothetical protein EXS62_01070 [Candidatus Kaiserbacteria bacterium]|nr:hypothetical protein [Candidatus Kaiserbacteria bacterium]